MSGNESSSSKKKRRVKTPARKSTRAHTKTECFNSTAPPDISTQWDTDQVTSLLHAVLKHGHLNYDEILKALPGKTLDNYKGFLRELKNMKKSYTKVEDHNVDNCTEWIEVCEAQYIKHRARHATLDLHLLLKLLSIDGVVENHPLPEDAGGVDYAGCYRLLSQVILGHPIQPVSESTVNLIYDILEEVFLTVEQNEDVVKCVKDSLLAKFAVKPTDIPESKITNLYHSKQSERPIKVYQRKPSTTLVEAGQRAEENSSKTESMNDPSSTIVAERLRSSSHDVYHSMKANDAPLGSEPVCITLPPPRPLGGSISGVSDSNLTYADSGIQYIETITRSNLGANGDEEKMAVDAPDSNSLDAKATVVADEAMSIENTAMISKPRTSFYSKSGSKVYQKRKSPVKAETVLVGLEQKVLRDVGLNPLQLPTNMLFNANYPCDTNKKTPRLFPHQNSKMSQPFGTFGDGTSVVIRQPR